MKTRARFLSLARSKLRLCSANHRPGYWSNLPCDWPSTAWAYSEQETENGPSSATHHAHNTIDVCVSVLYLQYLWYLCSPSFQFLSVLRQVKQIPSWYIILHTIRLSPDETGHTKFEATYAKYDSGNKISLILVGKNVLEQDILFTQSHLSNR